VLIIDRNASFLGIANRWLADRIPIIVGFSTFYFEAIFSGPCGASKNLAFPSF